MAEERQAAQRRQARGRCGQASASSGPSYPMQRLQRFGDSSTSVAPTFRNARPCVRPGPDRPGPSTYRHSVGLAGPPFATTWTRARGGQVPLAPARARGGIGRGGSEPGPDERAGLRPRHGPPPRTAAPAPRIRTPPRAPQPHASPSAGRLAGGPSPTGPTPPHAASAGR